MNGQNVGEFIWAGSEKFYVGGTARHDNTLYIESTPGPGEQLLWLKLPTLAITYADLEFANAVGGMQRNYPASQAYGAQFFDPPKVLHGEAEIEKFTWIRGALTVEIGPELTIITWYRGKTLVIPRLRIDPDARVEAVLGGNVPVEVKQPLEIQVAQLAEGRPIGGISIVGRHPAWTPPPEPTEYDLWIEVVDGNTLEPVSEARLNLLRWDPQMMTPRGVGGFQTVDQCFANGEGVCHVPHRPVGQLEAVTLAYPGYRAVAKSFRALPGQPLRLRFFAWRLREDVVRYTWQTGDTLEQLAALSGHTPDAILRRNRLRNASLLVPGVQISLPCFEAAYCLEEGDTLDWLAQAFDYPDIGRLAAMNGVGQFDRPDPGLRVQLPGWHFFYARADDWLDRLDRIFGVPIGASRTVGRAYHPDPRLPFDAETIAIPAKSFLHTRAA